MNNSVTCEICRQVDIHIIALNQALMNILATGLLIRDLNLLTKAIS